MTTAKKTEDTEMSTTTRRERLEATLRHLEQAGPERLDQSYWAFRTDVRYGKQMHSLHEVVEGTVSLDDCGSGGCLAGHAVAAARKLGRLHEITRGGFWDSSHVAAWLGVGQEMFDPDPWDAYENLGYTVEWQDGDGYTDDAPTPESAWEAVCGFLRDELARCEP